MMGVYFDLVTRRLAKKVQAESKAYGLVVNDSSQIIIKKNFFLSCQYIRDCTYYFKVMLLQVMYHNTETQQLPRCAVSYT